MYYQLVNVITVLPCSVCVTTHPKMNTFRSESRSTFATQSPIPIHQNLEISSLCTHCHTTLGVVQLHTGILLWSCDADVNSMCMHHQHSKPGKWYIAAARFTIMAKSLSVVP